MNQMKHLNKINKYNLLTEYINGLTIRNWWIILVVKISVFANN